MLKLFLQLVTFLYLLPSVLYLTDFNNDRKLYEFQLLGNNSYSNKSCYIVLYCGGRLLNLSIIEYLIIVYLQAMSLAAEYNSSCYLDSMLGK